LIAASEEETVRIRAKHRCEYCRMHQSLQGAVFHIEHIVPRSAGGDDSFGNLALACPSCNLHKSNRVEASDNLKNENVLLFHPRTMNWSLHFRFQKHEVVALTAIGRATCSALKFNHPRRIKIRQAEEVFQLFPPTE
jgi:CRISPR/Cas system Type II protein with McrA/HNH and RuvC-like nuclease domain